MTQPLSANTHTQIRGHEGFIVLSKEAKNVMNVALNSLLRRDVNWTPISSPTVQEGTETRREGFRLQMRDADIEISRDASTLLQYRMSATLPYKLQIESQAILSHLYRLIDGKKSPSA